MSSASRSFPFPRAVAALAGTVLIATVVAATPALAATPPAVAKALRAAVNGPQRTPAFKKRDAARHPLKTLEFFGIRPGMTVIEVLPARGWYSEILAPFLHARGQLIEASVPVNSDNPFLHKMAAAYHRKLAGNPKVYGRVRDEPFAPPAYMALGAPHSADMVLTFRNMHDLVYANVHGEVTDRIMQRFFHSAWQVLKPGGTLGIVAHRANPGQPVAKSHMLGRLPQAYVIREAEKAGFRLAGTSDVNANPKDPRTMAVWKLPPTLNESKQKQAHYREIGEADNMTLRFVKPGGKDSH
ncbi:MAG TPA: hypothetical protein VFA86_13210 [Gammaproteobacteria bacterium]|nr:hypothetical protein [Gammaproteobacteria bacterium]